MFLSTEHVFLEQNFETPALSMLETKRDLAYASQENQCE